MIKTFVKRPVEIQAVQWDGYNFEEMKKFVGADGVGLFGSYKNPDLVIATLEGDLHTSVGDWIIRGVQGAFYPCKPDIFEPTSEAVSTASC